jgi:hypothetical protein
MKDSSGSWPCENADALRRRRITFSLANCSGASHEARITVADGLRAAEDPQTLRFMHFRCAAHLPQFNIPCPPGGAPLWRVGIRFSRFLIRTRFHTARVIFPRSETRLATVIVILFSDVAAGCPGW